jgi:hypothetical protein
VRVFGIWPRVWGLQELYLSEVDIPLTGNLTGTYVRTHCGFRSSLGRHMSPLTTGSAALVCC